MELKLDCRYFIGEKPCKYQTLCRDCGYHKPMGTRILIIKLGAIGDVLRTTPLLYGLKDKHPESFITWLVLPESYELLEGNPYIDRIYNHGFEALCRLQVEEFDILISLDKDPSACAIASLVKAKQKSGYGLDAHGNIFPFNKEAEYSFELGISDHLKFKANTKTYQETVFDIAGLKYNRQEYIFNLPEQDLNYSRDYLRKMKVKDNDLLIGLNTGCGDIFATKKWTIEGFLSLINKIDKGLKARIILLGGPNEIERNSEIKRRSKVKLLESGCNNTLKQFSGFIERCDVILTADTIAMHLAIALKKPVVAVFAPTASQEVDLYGRGKTIVSPIDCAPCYKANCDDYPSCMEMLSADEVFGAIRGLIKKK